MNKKTMGTGAALKSYKASIAVVYGKRYIEINKIKYHAKDIIYFADAASKSC